MIYRFDEAGHGEVFSETKKPDLEAVARQSLSRLRHSADRAPALRAQPRARARRRQLHAGRAVSPDCLRLPGRSSTCRCASCAAFPRSTPVSQEHGRRGDARRLADGGRPAVGAGVLPSLFAALSSLRAAFGLRASGRGHRHPNCGAGKLCQGQGELAARRLEQRMSKLGVARRRLARRAVRPFAAPAAAAGRDRRRAALRGRDHSPPATFPGRTRSARSRNGSARNSSAVSFRRPVSGADEPAFAAMRASPAESWLRASRRSRRDADLVSK